MPDAKAARKEQNFFQRIWNNIRQYIRETGGELRKVSWPTRQEAFNLTKIVLGVIMIIGLILFFLDLLFGELISIIISL